MTNFPAVQKGLLSETYNNGTVVKNLTYTNMKCVNYMLDKTNWSKYVSGNKADWAIGGPTLELLCLSYRGKNPNATNWPTITSKWGYNNAGFTDSAYLLTSGTVWNRDQHYWLASPSYYGDSYMSLVSYNTSSIKFLEYSEEWNGFRPVVHLSGTLDAKKIGSEIVYSVK